MQNLGSARAVPGLAGVFVWPFGTLRLRVSRHYHIHLTWGWLLLTPETLVATFVGKHTNHFKVCINSTSKSLQGASKQLGKAINQLWFGD